MIIHVGFSSLKTPHASGTWFCALFLECSGVVTVDVDGATVDCSNAINTEDTCVVTPIENQNCDVTVTCRITGTEAPEYVINGECVESGKIYFLFF